MKRGRRRRMGRDFQTRERSDRLPDHRAWDPAGALSGFNVRV
jgi:hypothetical protein